jgi:hypothetical protein
MLQQLVIGVAEQVGMLELAGGPITRMRSRQKGKHQSWKQTQTRKSQRDDILDEEIPSRNTDRCRANAPPSREKHHLLQQSASAQQEVVGSLQLLEGL